MHIASNEVRHESVKDVRSDATLLTFAKSPTLYRHQVAHIVAFTRQEKDQLDDYENKHANVDEPFVAQDYQEGAQAWR